MSEAVKKPFHGRTILLITPGFKPGDQAPEGYLAWHAWAEVQHKAGLRQVQCPGCLLWRYPQELSTQERSWAVQVKKGRHGKLEPRTLSAFICMKCAAVTAAGLAEGGSDDHAP